MGCAYPGEAGGLRRGRRGRVAGRAGPCRRHVALPSYVNVSHRPADKRTSTYYIKVEASGLPRNSIFLTFFAFFLFGYRLYVVDMNLLNFAGYLSASVIRPLVQTRRY